jgi:hypothetical protein
MAKWETTSITIRIKNRPATGLPVALKEDSDKLREYGREGWELVSVVPTESPSVLGFSKGTVAAVAFLKRQIITE